MRSCSENISKMPAERKESNTSVTGLFISSSGLMSPVPRKLEEDNHSFQMELDSAAEVIQAKERRHTQLVAVFLTLVVLVFFMILYMSPINESGGSENLIRNIEITIVRNRRQDVGTPADVGRWLPHPDGHHLRVVVLESLLQGLVLLLPEVQQHNRGYLVIDRVVRLP